MSMHICDPDCRVDGYDIVHHHNPIHSESSTVTLGDFTNVELDAFLDKLTLAGAEHAPDFQRACEEYEMRNP